MHCIDKDREGKTNYYRDIRQRCIFLANSNRVSNTHTCTESKENFQSNSFTE